MMPRILLVEDEKVMAKNIAFYLGKEGFSVDVAYDGLEGWGKFRQGKYDLLLLDWSLPGKDGLELCREVRKISDVPMIMITAKEEITDIVVGLEVGADDYLTKPFHQRELLARIHALLRRHRSGVVSFAGGVEYDGIELDKERMVLCYQKQTVPLTLTEMKLLDVFLKHPQHVYTRDYLFETVWGSSAGYSDRTVDVNISRLRRKIAELTGKKYLQAVRGMGYRFGDGE